MVLILPKIMDIQEALAQGDQFATDRGQPLNDLEKGVLRGMWQRQKYREIAKQENCSESHVKKVAKKLFDMFSEGLGEENLKKTNFKSTLERHHIYKIDRNNINNHNSNFHVINNFDKGNINICPEKSHPPTTQQNLPHPQTTKTKDTNTLRLDIKDAPDFLPSYIPTPDLTTLENWILEHKSRSILITGISGAGKTSTALQLISSPQFTTQFHHIIWLNLHTAPTLENTLEKLINFITPQTENNSRIHPLSHLSILLNYLTQNRTLIILDNIQAILQAQLPGYYQPTHENYANFFKIIAETAHHSCLILNSWEPPLNLLTLIDDHFPIQWLQLRGLGENATSILQEYGLLDEDKWPDLLNFYHSNPRFLKLACQIIKNSFAGQVSQYLSYQQIILGDKITYILEQHYQRLSVIEKTVINLLSQESTPLTFADILCKSSASHVNIFKAIESLSRRGLIQKNERGDQTFFIVIPVVKQYVIDISPGR